MRTFHQCDSDFGRVVFKMFCEQMFSLVRRENKLEIQSKDVKSAEPKHDAPFCLLTSELTLQTSSSSSVSRSSRLSEFTEESFFVVQRKFGVVYTYPKYMSAATATSILKIESYTCLNANWVLYLHNAVHTIVNFQLTWPRFHTPKTKVSNLKSLMSDRSSESSVYHSICGQYLNVHEHRMYLV